MLASEHLVTDGLNIRLTDEVEEGREDGLGDQVLGEVQQERYRRVLRRSVFPAELGEALRILREKILEDELLMLAVVDLLQLLPSRVL